MKYFRLKKLVVMVLLLVVANVPVVFAQDSTMYKRVYLSGIDASNTVEWDFKVTGGRNSGQWTSIPVPSNWELQGFGNYNYGHDYKDKEKELGKEHGLYRHRFTIPANWKGKVINIVFEGAMTDTKVRINGKSAGDIHQGAFYRFKYNISKLLDYGEENLLEVDVAKHSANESVNRAEREADFWIFGGIFRPVYLEVLPKQHFKRIAIDAKANGDFTVRLFVHKPEAKSIVHVDLFTVDGNKVGRTLRASIDGNDTLVNISGHFDGIIPWNPEKPTLYKVHFSLLKDGKYSYKKEETIGFRTVELRKNDGFYVNGKRIVFKGVNRHSFWPSTGRALSEANHLQDIKLIKEMNMNAVRMSHYPPDERFLDFCDSIGLFVLDEVTGWQDAYDTIVGPMLIKETILKDENHPSVVLWDHGNEGGWDFANEKWFHKYDFQKRPIIYPWLQRNGVDARHYPTYNYGVNRLANGQDVFMPTEFMHGLYDGGHGAGLKDYWANYSSSPLFAGGFLWSFSDEAVVRTDKGNILDSDGNHGPDGILGPYREKEGSFYTIKEIWSPVQIRPVTINKYFDGRLLLKNSYLYTNLKDCSFSWTLNNIDGFSNSKTIGSGNLHAPDIAPGETRAIYLNLPDNFADAEILTFTAKNPYGRELYTWRWPIKPPKEVAENSIAKINKEAPMGSISVKEGNNSIVVSVKELVLSFNRTNGHLESVRNSKGVVPFNGGPLPVGVETSPKGTEWEKDDSGNFILRVEYNKYPNYVQWKLTKSGLLHLEVGPLLMSKKNIDYIGISFNYPESMVKGVRWLGKGPYRVWKNRIEGAEMGLWQKDYNNTVTGASYDSLVYPEFKGYHADLYWMELQTTASPIKILSETPGLFFRLYTPEPPKAAEGGVTPPFPEGNLSFLYEIPAIGTKFKQAEYLGPSSQKGEINFHQGDRSYPIKLWFYFGGN